ncbi:MAG: FHA domain-containing protein [Chlorobia bacterium]|nr:FHA domain-containing protein [Fimbriimonadaceae bacterium]
MQLRKLLFILTLLPGVSLAQGRIKLDFGEAGDREVWVSDQSLLPASTLKAPEATLDLPLPVAENNNLYVWDRKTGNVAMKSVGSLKGTWKLTAADYVLAGKVVVRVEHEGDPVAVAFVKLKDAAGEKESQIDASKKGEAIFFGIKPGKVDVTVRYNSNGVDAEPAQQSFILNSKRAEPDPTFIVSLAQDVETVGSKEPDEGTVKTTGGEGSKPEDSKPADKPAPKGSVFGSIIVYLLALGAAGAAIYFGLRYMKDNQDKVKAQLQKVGVQVPDPQDPAQQDPGPAPIPIAPAPPQKIMLDDADPNLPPAPSTPNSVPPVSVSQPSLVMENGDVFPIPDGETSVGREAGNGLALVTESTVSRKHATIQKNGVEITVRDEGSSNGTFVNGVKVSTDVILRPGDQVHFGQVIFRYEA